MDAARWERLMQTHVASSQETDLVNQLKRRTNFIKFKPNGKTYSRRFFLVPSEDAVHYIGSKKASKFLAFSIKDVEEVRAGFSTATWRKCLAKGKINSNQSNSAFSILYNQNRKSLDLLAENEEERSRWIRGLEFIIQRYRSHLRTTREITDQWICNMFTHADVDHSGYLSLAEVERILSTMNIELNDDELEHYFNQANIRKETNQTLMHLSKDEFFIFYKFISQRPELLKIICQNNGSNNEELAGALAEYTVIYKMPTILPGVNSSYHSAPFFSFPRRKSKSIRLSNSIRRRRSASITPDNSPATGERRNFMTIEQFKDFLHNVQHIKALSIEDCSRLIARFEPSIEGRQSEEIGVDGFRLFLLHDEFCLLNAEKIHRIYHDMTRPLTDYFIATSHNTYIQNNQIYGDCTAETYIHALKNGCRAVEIDCYDGENIEPVVYHGKTLTTPISIREILQAIAKHAFTASTYPLIINVENHCSYEQQGVLASLCKEIFGDHLITKPLADNFQTLPSPEQLKYKILIRTRVSPKMVAKPNGNNVELATVTKKNLHPDFVEIVPYTQIISFNDASKSTTALKSFHTISLKESKADDLIKSDSPHHLDLINFTQRQLLRVYPDGMRQDSSNVHPPFYWTYGIQMVALNYQKDDEAMCIQRGFFSDNGRCGYLLKPSCLLGNDRSFDPKEKIFSKGKRLQIHIISGQNLPKERSTTRASDVIDPYVLVFTYGIECDYTEHRTPFIRNNGLNPLWDHKMSMDIYCPELCLVIFQVRDHNSALRSPVIGQACIPFNLLQLGYRHIKLENRTGDRIHGTLFVHVKIDDF